MILKKKGKQEENPNLNDEIGWLNAPQFVPVSYNWLVTKIICLSKYLTNNLWKGFTYQMGQFWGERLKIIMKITRVQTLKPNDQKDESKSWIWSVTIHFSNKILFISKYFFLFLGEKNTQDDQCERWGNIYRL